MSLEVEIILGVDRANFETIAVRTWEEKTWNGGIVNQASQSYGNGIKRTWKEGLGKSFKNCKKIRNY